MNMATHCANCNALAVTPTMVAWRTFDGTGVLCSPKCLLTERMLSPSWTEHVQALRTALECDVDPGMCWFELGDRRVLAFPITDGNTVQLELDARGPLGWDRCLRVPWGRVLDARPVGGA